MSTDISVILSLQTANALTRLNDFTAQAAAGLKHLATEALGLYASIEGLRKLDEAVKEAINLQEAVGRLSEKTGLSVPLLAALRSQANSLGLPFDELTTTLGRFSSNVFIAAERGGPIADMLARMGVAVTDAAGHLRSADAILADTVKWFGQTADGAAKANAAITLFGRGGQVLIPLLNEGAEGLERFKAAGSPITDESVAQATRFNVTLRELHENIELLWVQVANQLLPTLIQVVQQLDALTKSAQFNSAVVTSLVDVLKGLITAAAFVGIAFYDVGAEIGVAVQFWVNTVTVGVDTVKRMGGDLVNFIKDSVTLLNDWVLTAVKSASAVGLAVSGDFAGAWATVKASMAAVQADFALVGADIAGGLGHSISGVKQVFDEGAFQAAQFAAKIGTQWGNLANLFDSLWSGKSIGGILPSGGAPKAEVLPGPSTQAIRSLSEWNAISQEIYKLQVRMVETNPFERQADKIKQELGLIDAQRDAIKSQIDAAQANLKTAETDQQRISTSRELVRLGAEDYDLQKKKEDLLAKSTASGAFTANLQRMDAEWGNLSVSLTNGAFKTIQQGVDGMASALTSLIMGTKSAGQAFAEFGISLLSSFIQMILEAVLYATVAIPLLAALSTLMGGAPATIGAAATIAAISSVSSVIPREAGGPVWSDQPFLVGERGPELVRFGRAGQISSAAETANMIRSAATGGGGTQGDQSPVNIMMQFVDSAEAANQHARRNPEFQHIVVDIVRRNAHVIGVRG